ncbi:MAG: hypothetical protein WB660_10480 [Candidatus Sulfotelmatobacter sp.]
MNNALHCAATGILWRSPNTMPAPSRPTIQSAANGTLKLTTRALGGFSSSVALSVSGLLTGVKASFSPSTVASPGTGSGKSLTQTASLGLTVK